MFATGILAKLLTTKGLAIAATTVALSTGTAAAATGHLPSPRLLIESDGAEPTASSSPDETTTTSTESVDPTDDETPTAPENEAPEIEETTTAEEVDPVETEKPSNHGDDVSAVAHDDNLSGRLKGQAVSDVARGEHGEGEEEGESSDHESAEHPASSAGATRATRGTETSAGHGGKRSS